MAALTAADGADDSVPAAFVAFDMYATAGESDADRQARLAMH